MDDLQAGGAPVAIGGQLQVTREIHLDAVALPNRHGREQVQKPIEDARARLRDAGADALAIRVEGGRVEADAALPLREAGDGPERERHAEDLRVVPIHLIAQAEIADLVEAVEPDRG